MGSIPVIHFREVSCERKSSRFVFVLRSPTGTRSSVGSTSRTERSSVMADTYVTLALYAVLALRIALFRARWRRG